MHMGLAKSQRLKKTRDITQTYEVGEVFFAYPLKIKYVPRSEGCRIGISVPKRLLKNATNRNLIKRRIREISRQNILQNTLQTTHNQLQKSLALDLMIGYVGNKIESFQSIEKALQKFTQTYNAKL